LKGVRLDTEDILKGYLFSFDPSDEIRIEWGKLKKKVFELESYRVKYPLIKIVEQFLYCDWSFSVNKPPAKLVSH